MVIALSKNRIVQLQGKFEELVTEMKSRKLIQLLGGYLLVPVYVDFKVSLRLSEVQNHPHASTSHG